MRPSTISCARGGTAACGPTTTTSSAAARSTRAISLATAWLYSSSPAPVSNDSSATTSRAGAGAGTGGGAGCAAARPSPSPTATASARPSATRKSIVEARRRTMGGRYIVPGSRIATSKSPVGSDALSAPGTPAASPLHAAHSTCTAAPAIAPPPCRRSLPRRRRLRGSV